MANTYSSTNGFACDALEIFMRFKKFTEKEMNKCVKDALQKGAKIIQKQAKDNLKQRLPNSTKRNVVKYTDTLVDAVRVGKYRKEQADERTVHIMGSRQQYSGTFRTRFFEKGVDDLSRKNKNGKIIFGGSIQPLYFFRDAIVSTKDEVIDTINKTLEDKINEINNTKL